MEIFNYTGKKIGLVNVTGQPIQVLPSHGNARCEVELLKSKIVGLIPIYEKKFSRVVGLPSPDINHEKLYIVDKAVADSFGWTRRDLLVADRPVLRDGSTYYHLSKAC